MNIITKGYKEKHYVGAIFCDLSEVFEYVDFEILLKKLKFCGLRDSAIVVLRSYLQDRQQITHLNGNIPQPLYVKYGARIPTFHNLHK